MKVPLSMEKNVRFTPLVISVSYGIISALWVVITDYLLADLIKNPDILTEYQTFKGWFFIILTAFLLYYFIRASFKRIEDASSALITSENKYRMIFEEASDGIILTDKSGCIIQVNSRFSEMLGLKAEQLSGMNIKDLIPKEDLERSPVKFNELYSGLTALSERNFLNKSGEIVQTELSAGLLENDLIQAIVRDISQRKKIESELRESEQQYRLLFRENPHPMWVYDIETLRFLAVNNVAIGSYGYSQEEFLSMTIMDIRPQEDLSSLDNNLKTSFDDFRQSGPWRHKKKNGEIIFVEITSNFIFFSGRKARIALANDITYRKAAIEALQISELRYRSLFEKSPISIWEEDFSLIKNHIDLLKKTGIVDFREYLNTYPEEIPASISMVRILDVNEATVELYEAKNKEEVLSGVSMFADQGFYSAQKESVIAVSENKTRFEIETSSRTLKEKKINIFYRWTVAEGYENTYGKVLVSIVDISERVKAEEEVNKLNAELEQRVINRTEQLEAANRELEAFSYSVSHDLRAPLRAINGFSQILLDDFSGKFDPEAQRLLKLISGNTYQMEQLIEDLLSFSRLLSKEKVEININMQELVGSVAEELLKSKSGRSISMNIKQLPPVNADPSMIKQVWINLISNAVKFTKMRDCAEIEIGGSVQDNMAVYYIKDNGIGFDMEYAHKLFKVFQRLHSSEEFEGTGIGLALVQRIIKRHNGTVWAEGEVNKGAKVYFSLPLFHPADL